MQVPSSLEKRVLLAIKEASPQVAEIVVETLEASHKNSGTESIAFVRAMRAISKLVKTLQADEAAAQSTDLQVLIALLRMPGNQGLLAEVDPLAPARIRGLEMQAEILQAEGGCVFSTEFAGLVGMSAQAVDKARKSGALIAFPRGQAKYCYPIWQIENGAVLRGLKESIRALGDASNFTKANFFLSANSRLCDKRPLDLLRDGKAKEVIAAATAFGEHGAA